MREIKFRAWHKGNRSKNGRIINEPQMLHDEKPGDCLVYKNQGQNIESIMQFTGLLDKNGVEIFEGDIVKACDGSFNGKKMFRDPGEVKIVNGNVNLPQWVREEDWDSTHYVEVIGNIHQQPELLIKEN